MYKPAIIWIQAIKSGYIVGSEWVQWAESAMLKVKTVPAWLVDLYYACNTEQALGALFIGMYDEGVTTDLSCAGDMGVIDRTQIYLSFLYLRYERGDISLNDLLLLAGECTDAANYSQPPCEALFSMLNEAEGNVVPIHDIPLTARVLELFMPFREVAQKCLLVLGLDKSTRINT